MPLILAIVADPLEAAQLAHLIQGRLSVDLVQAAEVGEGLLALDDRIPDLILTSPLMSPFDDGVLDEYLRDLGPAGTHVQTLRIPVLSHGPKKKPRLSFSLRRSKPEPVTPQGCEPKVFADEIEHYLERAAEEKRHAVANDVPPTMPQDESPASPIQEEWSTPIYVPDVAPTYTPDPPAAQPVRSAPEPEVDHVGWRADLLDRPPVEKLPTYEPINAPAHVEEVPTYEPVTVSAPLDQGARRDETPVYVDEPAPARPHAVVTEPVEPEAQSAVAWTPPSIQESVAPSSIEEPPMAPSRAGEPIAEEVLQQPVTTSEVRSLQAPTIGAVSEEPVVVSSPAAPIKEDAAPVSKRAGAADHDEAIKSTPSFKAALAAIRAAWGKPSRKGDVAGRAVRDELPAASHRIPIPQMAVDEDDESPAMTEVSPPVEIDLTGAVEMLDEAAHGAGGEHAHAHASQSTEETWVPGPPQPAAPRKPAETEEVYELAVEPDLRALESRLFTARARAPLSPARTQESASTSVPSAPQPDNPHLPEEKRRTESAGERRMKKKRGSKGAKEKAARLQAQPQPQIQTVQDEWGMFDPNRCGFAALVDKLDKVADEKSEQRPNGNKVRVISYS